MWYRYRDRIMPRDGRLVAIERGAPAVVLQEAKDYLRVDYDLEDDVIDTAILAVQDQLVPPEGWLGRTLTDATYRLDLPEFASEIVLPAPPFKAIESFEYVDTDGVMQSVDPDLYEVTGGDPAVIVLGRNKTWPCDVDHTRPDAVQIKFTAGYGAATDVPSVIRQWIMYQVAQIHDLRQPVVVGTIISQTPFIRDMLESWRVRL